VKFIREPAGGTTEGEKKRRGRQTIIKLVHQRSITRVGAEQRELRGEGKSRTRGWGKRGGNFPPGQRRACSLRKKKKKNRQEKTIIAVGSRKK